MGTLLTGKMDSIPVTVILKRPDIQDLTLLGSPNQSLRSSNNSKN